MYPYPECKDNLAIGNGTVIYMYLNLSHISLPQEAMYKCFVGYQLLGQRFRNCRDIDGDGKAEWTDVGHPKCKIISKCYYDYV